MKGLAQVPQLDREQDVGPVLPGSAALDSPTASGPLLLHSGWPPRVGAWVCQVS